MGRYEISDLGMPERPRHVYGFRLEAVLVKALVWHLLVLRVIAPLIVQVLSMTLSKDAFPLHKLSKKELIQLPSYITGIIHAVIITTLSGVLAYKLFEDKYSNLEWFFGHMDFAIFFVEWFMGYLTQDLLYIIYHYKSFGDKEAIVHHTVFLLICIYCVEGPYLIGPLAWLTACEASTPFVNMRWILHVLGQKDSFAHFINGWAMLVFFFITRVVIYFFGLVHIIRNYKLWIYDPFKKKGSLGITLVVFGLILMYGLQCYWFSKIFKGAMKVLKKRSSAAKDAKLKLNGSDFKSSPLPVQGFVATGKSNGHSYIPVITEDPVEGKEENDDGFGKNKLKKGSDLELPPLKSPENYEYRRRSRSSRGL